MWHEARRREKATQKLLTDHRKRADKRREESRIDPSSLLQVHGVKSKIHIDSCTHKQAAKSLVVWQGDNKTTIDRFDVRATVSSIPKDDGLKESKQLAPKGRSTVVDADESDPMRKLLNFERYRLLIQNDLNKVPEATRLRLVSKSEFLCEAKMKKLENNWFGTSAESSFSHSALDRQPHGPPMLKRSQGVSIGHNYNQVPPPSNLLGLADEGTDMPDATNLRNVIDLDDCDNINLDGVIRSHLEPKRVTDVTSKYGLSSEEFHLLIDSESKCTNLITALHRLRKLGDKKSDVPIRNEQHINDSTFYGPALPPEMMEKSQAASGSGSPSSDSSPVRQRSPSGASIPLRLQSEQDEPPTPERPSYGVKINQEIEKLEPVSRTDRPSPARDLAPGAVRRPEAEKPNGNALLLACNNGKLALDEVYGRANDAGGSSRSRRAATPLAYKRHRRSSRSLSREARSLRRHRRRRDNSRDSSSRSQSPSRSSSSSRSRGTRGPSTSASSVSTRSSHSRGRRRRSRSRSPSAKRRSRREESQGSPRRTHDDRKSSRHRRSGSRDSRGVRDRRRR